MKKVAVILCGSGARDGSEVREAVAALWALNREGAQVQCFAPDAPQKDVVNALTNEAMPSATRNMLIESARIARGDVKPLSEYREANFDALIIPGGFGVAKNLCSFAYFGSAGNVLPDAKDAIQATHKAGKPIGAICIAPALVALALPSAALELTLGGPGEAPSEIEKLGHKHKVCASQEICVDEKHKLVTTPAYMHANAPLTEIFEGIEKLVKRVLAF